MPPERREARAAELKSQILELRELLSRRDIDGGWELADKLTTELKMLFGVCGPDKVPTQEDFEISFFIDRFLFGGSGKLQDEMPRRMWMDLGIYAEAWESDGVFKSVWLKDVLSDEQLAVLESEGVRLTKK
jgi:hypothetical protein